MGWRNLMVVLSALGVVALGETAIAGPAIPKAQLESMFANMRDQSHWDTTKPLVWGYFFTNRTRPPLEVAAKRLEEQGYRLVEMHHDKVWWLHVEKVEAHDVDSLDARNALLRQFAADNGLDSYDGMDVGPAP